MSYDPPDHIQALLKQLPTKPGVYLHKDHEGKIIYVGKAINLRHRVRSYFHSQVDSRKTDRLRRQIHDIEIITTDSELEALLLENTLIKKHKPRYNIRLKDDKRYPYIKVHWADDFPKVTVTRNVLKDGSRYFGPYMSAWAVHETLDTLRKVFPFLTCDRIITGKDERACLYYDIKLCNGPCIGAVNRQAYREMIKELMAFLQGKSDHVQTNIREKMQKSAELLDFEAAARYRDQLKAIDQVIAKQKVISTANADQDVIAFARSEDATCVQLFFIRYGKLIGREYFMLENAEQTDDAELLSSFLSQFYENATHIPRELLLPNEFDELHIVEQWLTQKRGTKVTLHVPQRGDKYELLEMVKNNAQDTINTVRQQWASDRSKHTLALSELQTQLQLPRPPVRIECYDIAHTQGSLTVASMVVFIQGAPAKTDYRKFNINTGNDDYASMREVLTRRFERYRASQQGELHTLDPLNSTTKESAWALLPDLLVIDGGKGQLHVANEVLQQFGLQHELSLISLAKREEEIFLPDQPLSILLPRDSQALYLLQRVRDEAHRFANEGHRARRSKVGLASILDGINGVGPKRRKALLTQFGSLEGIRGATVEELASVPGIPYEVAAAIKAQLD